MGVVSPLGSTVDSMWENAKNGVCGIDNITKFDATDFKVKVAGEVRDFDAEKYQKDEASNAINETWLPISTQYYLFLSGTPFRAINTG